MAKPVWNKRKTNWLSAIARKCHQSSQRHLKFIDILKPSFTQLFEPNKVNQTHGIKWIFFSLFPTDENKCQRLATAEGDRKLWPMLTHLQDSHSRFHNMWTRITDNVDSLCTMPSWVHLLIPFHLNLTKTSWGRYYYSDFIDEEIET